MTTPTPAPALTDEEMGSSPSDNAQIDDDVRALVEGESMPEETAWSIIAAVIACERERISRELLAAAERMATSASHHIAFRQGIRWAAAATEVNDYA